MLGLILALCVQDDDSLKKAQADIDAAVARQGKMTVGGVAEVLQLANNPITFFTSQKKWKEAVTVCAYANDAVLKALTSLESKPPEVRKVIMQLEKGAKRAAAKETDEKKIWSYKFAFDKANLQYQIEVATIRALVGMGLDYFRDGAYEESEEALKEAEEKLPSVMSGDPASIDKNARLAPILLAQNYFAQGKYGEAGVALRRGIVLVPEWGDEEEFQLKQLHKDQAAFATMLKKLEEYVETKPADLDARFFLGYAYYFSDKRERSKPVFESILEKNKDDRGAKYFLERLRE